MEYIRSGGDRTKINTQRAVSQEAIASKINTTKAVYSKIENSDIVINIFHISSICSVFDISVVEFMEFVEQKVKALEEEGIEVKQGKVPFRLDSIRWMEKLKEKASAKYNSKIRELKKNKELSIFDDEDQLTTIRNECKQEAYEELEAKFSLEDALKEYHESQ
ncbi:helix-turn-helix transcriptional regulator [Vibrio parahaemolyticus]|nr:helix-turn-helix transcriptional regulator [Vibrio parahaemolyticus]